MIVNFCVSTGDGSYGDKTVEDVARDLISASHQNLFRFETPQVVFAFFDGVTKTVVGEPYHNWYQIHL